MSLMLKAKSRFLFLRRKERIRQKLKKVAEGYLRLTVHRTNKHIYVQIIDDATSSTVISASTVDKEFKEKNTNPNGGNKDAATKVGEMVAKRALKKGLGNIVFDRSGYLYHGRIKALADAAREAGLKI